MNNTWTRTIGVNHNGSDEWYTPRNAVEPLLKYLYPGSKILCPFDAEESEYVKVFRENGFNVSFGHILTGQDFFKLERKNIDADYIISNPPFSLRDKILERLVEFRIPFAMLFNANGLFDSKKRFELAKYYDFSVIYLSPRVRYIDSLGNRNSPPFQSAYITMGITPRRLYFERI